MRPLPVIVRDVLVNDLMSERGRSFHAEATLSQYSAEQRNWFTLILRDVEERGRSLDLTPSAPRRMDLESSA